MTARRCLWVADWRGGLGECSRPHQVSLWSNRTLKISTRHLKDTDKQVLNLSGKMNKLEHHNTF